MNRQSLMWTRKVYALEQLGAKYLHSKRNICNKVKSQEKVEIETKNTGIRTNSTNIQPNAPTTSFDAANSPLFIIFSGFLSLAAALRAATRSEVSSSPFPIHQPWKPRNSGKIAYQFQNIVASPKPPSPAPQTPSVAIPSSFLPSSFLPSSFL
ncbi:hypothetical protein CPC08DRAFT_375957 [Agrocybe pediades]|nr:hypothetical protein CPC08DRAFT_375957 [Agrocybe pediades]